MIFRHPAMCLIVSVGCLTSYTILYAYIFIESYMVQFFRVHLFVGLLLDGWVFADKLPDRCFLYVYAMHHHLVYF